MSYIDDEGVNRGVHNSLGDLSDCRHQDTLRPLAWTVSQDDTLRRGLVGSRYRNGVPFSKSETVQSWVPKTQPEGLTNVMAIFQFLIELRGQPNRPL
jgi:hypothetical protein